MIYWLTFFILIFSLSIDSFIAGLSIGISRIKTPKSSILIICFINTFILTCSYLLGDKLYLLLPSYWITILASVPFSILGFSKLLDCNTSFSFKQNTSKIKCIFKIFHRPSNAWKVDLDFSKTLSKKEAILLATSLSLDNLVAGIGIGMKSYPLYDIIFFNFLINFILFIIGNRLFLKLTDKQINWNLFSGIILIVVGIYRIFC